MTEPRVPSPEQAAVIEATHPRLAVTASAGAGKTFVLVERYLRHVTIDGFRPDEILTITFTNKAAAVMKGRIVQALRERGLTEMAQVAETGPIQTIHSFCERLLRENALEAGLDPRFEILTEAQARRWATECVREAIATDLADLPEADRLIAYLAGRRKPGAREDRAPSPYALLEHAVVDVLEGLRSSGARYEQVRDRHSSPEALQAWWEAAILEELEEPLRSEVQRHEGPTLRHRIQAAAKALRVKRPAWARGEGDATAEAEALVHTCGLVQLACEAWWRLSRRMIDRQQLDFNELEIRAVRLLERSEATRARLQDQYRVAMVDEAQDVNPVQYRLLRSLGVQREMLVGDGQQSIYGFRQADREHFERYIHEVGEMRLSRNFRSDSGILAFVDLLFCRLWGEHYRRMAPADESFDLEQVVSIDCSGVELWEHEARDARTTARAIARLIEDGAAPGEIAVLVRGSAYASDLHLRLREVGVPARIVGGSERFYARLEIRDLANALRAVADPQDDFALLACLRSPVVGLSLDAVVLLGVEPHVAQRLGGFEPPLDEDREALAQFLSWYRPLAAIGDRLSAWEALSEVLAKSGYVERVARRAQAHQQLANVRKLLSLAAREPDLGPVEFAEQIREIQDLRHKEGDAPVGAEGADEVTLMTIHKAKGLEFPIVVVPQTYEELAKKPQDVAFDSRSGLVATRFGGQSLMHRLLSERKRQREEEEELRVLYVALTRACRRLCVCTYPAKGVTTLSKILRDKLGASTPPGLIVRDALAYASRADCDGGDSATS